MAGHLMAMQNQVTELALVDLVINIAQLVRPDLVEDHAAGGRLNHADIRGAITTAFATEVRIAQADTRMVRDSLFSQGKSTSAASLKSGRCVSSGGVLPAILPASLSLWLGMVK